MWMKQGTRFMQGLPEKKKQLKSSKYKVFLNVKCIFHAFQYHPTCHRLLIRFIYYSLIGSSISCANYVSESHVYWQSLTSDDVSLMPNIPSSENWDMYRSVGVLVHFQLNDISVRKWRDYDALGGTYSARVFRPLMMLQKRLAFELFSKIHPPPLRIKKKPFFASKTIWIVSKISIKRRCDSQFLDSALYIFFNDSQVALC